MPTVMSMRWKGVTPEQYEAVRKIVDWDNNPLDGGLFHIAAFTNGELRVVDLWESAEKFQHFADTRLMQVVQEVGIAGEPEVELYAAHNVYAPAYESAAA